MPDLADISQPGAQAPPPAGPSSPTAPHAGLLRMVQGLALGLDSFAKAAATGGREGGVQEVQQVRGEQQRQQIAGQQEQRSQQQFQTQQQEADLRMKTMNANLIMQQAAYHHALQMYPAEEKEANLKVLNQATASYKDALSEGYDIADPGQAALWRQMQQNIISIPFSAGQSQQEVLSTTTAAASKNGKNLTDFVPLVDYKDDKHGEGGNITLVPAANLQQVQATPRQISMGMAQMKATLDTATTTLGKDDPQVKGLAGKIDTIQKVLDSGGKPSAYDFIQLNSSVLGPLATRIGGASQTLKLQKEKADTLKAQQEAVNALPANQVKLAASKAAAEAAVKQPYEVALKQMEAPIAAATQSNQKAQGDAEVAAKAFADRMSAVEEVKSSIVQAGQGNLTAARAAILKLTGIAIQAGSKRMPPEALAQMKSTGSMTDRMINGISNILTGNPISDDEAGDIVNFANAEARVAETRLRTGINMTNAIHKTKIDPEELIAASGFKATGAQPLGITKNQLKQQETAPYVPEKKTKAEKWGVPIS